jgi:hypothetical protein
MCTFALAREQTLSAVCCLLSALGFRMVSRRLMSIPVRLKWAHSALPIPVRFVSLATSARCCILLLIDASSSSPWPLAARNQNSATRTAGCASRRKIYFACWGDGITSRIEQAAYDTPKEVFASLMDGSARDAPPTLGEPVTSNYN